MQSYPWPGNVRELIAAIRRAVVLSDTHVVRPADLRLQMPQLAAPTADPTARPAPRGAAERAMLLKTLQENSFNISRAAHALGRSRMTLYRMLARNGLAQHHDVVVRETASLSS